MLHLEQRVPRGRHKPANALVVPCPGHSDHLKSPTQRWAILFRPAKRDWSVGLTHSTEKQRFGQRRSAKLQIPCPNVGSMSWQSARNTCIYRTQTYLFFAVFFAGALLDGGFFVAAFFAGAFLADTAFLAEGLAGFLGDAFLATACLADAACFVAGLTAGVDTATFFASGTATAFLAPGVGFVSGVGADTAGTGAGATAGTAAPFALRPRFAGAGVSLPGAAALATAAFPRPRLGAGGGGAGGGSYGFSKFIISVCDRSLPSSSNRNASSVNLGYSASWGVIRNSAISGNGNFSFICRHFVKKFFSF